MENLEAGGLNLPRLGLGTYGQKGDNGRALIESAIAAGYRLIDTAAMYGNEREVGAAVRASGIPREEFVIVTKVWPDRIAQGQVLQSAEESLDRLGLDWIDLFLLPWPEFTVPLADQIASLNAVRTTGIARHIGVANYTAAMLEEAQRQSHAPIVCNQVEHHPLLARPKITEACERLGIALMAHCPLARAHLFDAPPVVAAAGAHGKTPAQIILRWQLQHPGVVPIPGSSDAGRLRENIDVFDFSLSEAEMANITALQSAHQRVCDPDFPGLEWDD